jgi:hypothetical protein
MRSYHFESILLLPTGNGKNLLGWMKDGVGGGCDEVHDGLGGLRRLAGQTIFGAVHIDHARVGARDNKKKVKNRQQKKKET